MARRKRLEGNRKNDEQDAVEVAWAEALRRAAGEESARAYVTPFGAYSNNLAGFGREVLGHKYWPAQEAIMRALMDKHKVAVRSCRKSGKTYSSADIALGFLNTAPSIVITSAPTVRQVRELIWSRIRSSHARARTRLPGVPGIQSLRVDHDWYAIGVATSDPENVLGFHAGVDIPDDEETEKTEVNRESVFDSMVRIKSKDPAHRLLLIFDEAIGIPQPIFDALEGSMSGDNVYALMQANPRMSSDDNHSFATAFRKGSGWWRVHIAAEKPQADPVGADESFYEVPEWLLPKSWIASRKVEWGEESPLYQSDVLGCFTTADLERQIVPLHILEGADKYEIFDDERAASRHIGCDVAGGETAGKDWCTATLWVNGVLSCQHKWKSPDTMHSMAILEALVERWGPPGQRIPWSNVHIDATGVGKGICDRLRQRGLFVDAVNFGAKPRYDWKHITGEMKFRDRKSELYWVMRRALQEGLAVLPRKYTEAWRQMQWHTYMMIARSNDTALAVAESKDMLRDRYGKSPDEADAAVLGWSRATRVPSFRLVGAGSVLRP